MTGSDDNNYCQHIRERAIVYNKPSISDFVVQLYDLQIQSIQQLNIMIIIITTIVIYISN